MRAQQRHEQRRAMEAVRPEMDSDQAFGGIARLWRLPVDHPFNDIFQHHDQQYALARGGFIKGPNSKAVDDTTLRAMLARADHLDSNALAFAARYFFYPAMRVWGFFKWPKEAKA